MPLKPKKPCNHIGCNQLTNTRYCSEHKSVEDKARGSAHERGYNHRWSKYSKWYLKQHVFCKLQYKGCDNIAQCVDHIKPAEPNSEAFFDPDNHQAACIRCNSAKGRREDRGAGKPFEANMRMAKGFRFDGEGEMVPSNVYIVWGSPASGKTTYVKNNMSGGDMVIDLDLIKQSLSMEYKTNAADNLLDTAISVRNHLYHLVEKREFTCDNVWIVAGLPDGEERNKLINRLKPTRTIFIEATESQCMERALNDPGRQDKEKQRYIINKWFKRFYGDT